MPANNPSNKNNKNNKNDCKSNSNSGGSSGLLKDYEVLGEIGTGSYGTCMKIRRVRDGAVLVWKELSYVTMTDAEKRYLCSEVNLLKSLNHPNVVKYVDRIHDRETGRIYIIMEHCEGGDLLKRIRATKEERKYIPEEKIWQWLTQLALALRCCHCRQGVKAVLHRDLKPANCFLDWRDNLKLGDFGLARVLHNNLSFASTFVGTPYYMSPEQMQKSAYTEKSDIWAYGIVAYELASLKPPFLAEKQRELAERIMRGQFEPIPSRYSDELSNLIARCLSVRPEERPSVEEILELSAIRHRVPDDELPEPNLKRWADQLRAYSDFLLNWEESLIDEERRSRLRIDTDERRLRRLEAQLAADRAERELELNRRQLQLCHLREQLEVRGAELRELENWLRSNGLGDSVRSKASWEETLTDIESAGWSSQAATPTKDDCQPKSRNCQPSPSAPVPVPRRSVLRSRNLRCDSSPSASGDSRSELKT